MDIKFLMLYMITFIAVVYNCFQLGAVMAELEKIEKELENR